MVGGLWPVVSLRLGSGVGVTGHGAAEAALGEWRTRAVRQDRRSGEAAEPPAERVPLPKLVERGSVSP